VYRDEVKYPLLLKDSQLTGLYQMYCIELYQNRIEIKFILKLLFLVFGFNKAKVPVLAVPDPSVRHH
jgi:hypothetical protein